MEADEGQLCPPMMGGGGGGGPAPRPPNPTYSNQFVAEQRVITGEFHAGFIGPCAESNCRVLVHRREEWPMGAGRVCFLPSGKNDYRGVLSARNHTFLHTK